MFVQRLVDNLDKYWDELDEKQRTAVQNYMDVSIEMATKNLSKQLMDNLAKAGKLGGGLPPSGASPGDPGATGQDPAAMAEAMASGGGAPAPVAGQL
jgi:hypothetical protein